MLRPQATLRAVTAAQADLYLGMPKDTATVQALERMKAAGDIMECGGPALCGVVALESGYGEGYYAAETTTVHGLWPENQPYGTSICAAVGDTAEVPDYAWVKVSLPLEEPPLKTAPLIHHEPGRLFAGECPLLRLSSHAGCRRRGAPTRLCEPRVGQA